jgi:hypothetical protein
MRRAVLLLALCLAWPAWAEERLNFWNLTSSTVTNLAMAAAGTSQFGPNQCANDPDGVVDHDERLRLTGVAPGRYDVMLTTKAGRTCTVRNVLAKASGKYAFSLSDGDLTECSAP